MFKKFMATLLASVMLMSMSVGAFAQQNSLTLDDLHHEYLEIYHNQQELDIIDNLINEYKSDEQFIKHYKQSPKDAISMVKGVINSEINWIDKTFCFRNYDEEYYDGEWYLNSVPDITQNTYTCCGATSALQAIYSKGCEGYVDGEYHYHAIVLDGYGGSPDGPSIYHYVNSWDTHTYITGTAASSPKNNKVILGSRTYKWSCPTVNWG